MVQRVLAAAEGSALLLPRVRGRTLGLATAEPPHSTPTSFSEFQPSGQGQR